ncbi:MAG: glycosyltransferase family 39 protein [Chloroflexota bacterium]
MTRAADSPTARAAPLPVSAAAPWWRRIAPVGVLLAFALGLRLVLWNRAVGFEQGDPLEYVNIAYKLAFGVGIEWWDLRPLLLSLIYVPVLYVAQLWPDPSGEAMVRALRLVSVLFGVGVVGVTYLLGRDLAGDPDRRRTGELVGLGAGLLVAVNPVVNRMSVSTYAEVPSTFFVVFALWLLVRALSARPERVLLLALAGGLAIGAGCMVRYQAIFFLPAVGLWVLVVALVRGRPHPPAPSPLRWRGEDEGAMNRAPTEPFLVGARFIAPVGWWGLLLGFGGGLLLAILAQAVIELLAYGRPFHSLLASFEYNVTSGLAPVEFGQEPFGWFLTEIPSWLGLVTAALVVCGLPSLVRGPSVAGWRLIGLAGLAMFVALSALPHKESRFMAQVLPLLAVFAAQGAATLSRAVVFPLFRLRERGLGGEGRPRGLRGQGVLAALLVLAAATPMLAASWALDLQSNVGYVLGVKRAAELRPGSTLGTIPWLVARPYAGTRLTLTRMDRNVWSRRDEVAQTVEQSDFLLFPEYWLLEDREVDKLVDARFKSIESYEDGVVLYQSRRLEDPNRRRSR